MRNLLLISGLDPSGGAGFVADVRTASACGVRPVGVTTALTEQNTGGVCAVNPVPAEVLHAQLTTLLTDVEVAAVKIGLLANQELALVISRALALTAAPVVWDPVGRASSGGLPLFEGSWPHVLQTLTGHVTVVTPNVDELWALVGVEDPDLRGADSREPAGALAHALRCAVLVTGGHGTDEKVVCDLLVRADGSDREFFHPRLPGGTEVHGTGCALSTALASELAKGVALEQGIATAQQFVARSLGAATAPGRGAAAIW